MTPAAAADPPVERAMTRSLLLTCANSTWNGLQEYHGDQRSDIRAKLAITTGGGANLL